MTPDLSVLIPFYDEAGNVLPLIEETVEALNGLNFEIIAVNDASTDATAAELAEAKSRWPGLLTVRTHVERVGKSAALFTGLKYVRGDWVQLLDGDGQNDPADTRRVWDILFVANEFDALKLGEAPVRLGLITGKRTSRNDSGFKWVQSRLANGLRRLLLNDDASDSGCGWKLIHAEAFRELPYFAAMHRFFPALVKRAGWAVIEEPVTDRPRRHGRSKYGFFGRLGAGIFDLAGVFWLVRRGQHGLAKEWLAEQGKEQSED
ncbi:MAG: glycosyltransferase family 2 protein [Hyphomonadaceae bacterium]